MILSEYLPTVAVAQLVEHWIVIPRVAGSSPVGRPIFFIFYGSLHCSYFRDDSRRFRIFPR